MARRSREKVVAELALGLELTGPRALRVADTILGTLGLPDDDLINLSADFTVGKDNKFWIKSGLRRFREGDEDEVL